MAHNFFAFISYRHTDIKAAKRLQFLLESYNLPTMIHYRYLQLIIPQYFISNKSGIWSLSLIVHSKG